jgi:hypothetical protein
VQIEPRQVRVPPHRREHPRRLGLVPQTPHPRPGPRAQRDPPLHRGAAEAGQRGRFVHQRIRLDAVGFPGIAPAALEQTLHSRRDPRQHAADFFVRRRRQGPEPERPLGAFEEDAVEEQRVEMDVQVQPAPEPLDDRHRARSPSADASAAPALTLEAKQHADRHPEHRARQPVIPRQHVPQPIRQAQHPLAHRDSRQYPVDQPGRALGHASPAATRAEASPLARERHQPLERALGALQAREAVRQDPAGQKVSELLLDERG